MTDPTSAGCTDPCIACMTDESHDPAPSSAPNPAAHAAVPSVPADADLRDRIAQALADNDGWVWAEGFDKTQSPSFQGYLREADAVMAVLPAPADQTAEEGRLRAKVYEWQGSYLDEVKLRQGRDTVVARVRQMVDAWEQRLPETIRTATAVDAIRHALDSTEPPSAAADRAALSESERQFLTFALDQAAEEMSLGDGFTADDEAALEKLRRMADEAQQP